MSTVRAPAPQGHPRGEPSTAPRQSAPLGWLCLALGLLALVAAGLGLLATGGEPSTVSTVHAGQQA